MDVCVHVRHALRDFPQESRSERIKEMEVKFLEKISKVRCTKRAREEGMAPEGEPGVIRTVWNRVVGGGELAVRKMSCSTAEKGKSSQEVAGCETSALRCGGQAEEA
jgi:hypothetical protein